VVFRAEQVKFDYAGLPRAKVPLGKRDLPASWAGKIFLIPLPACEIKRGFLRLDGLQYRRFCGYAVPPRGLSMTRTFEATYENGLLKPTEPLPLREHEKVRVTIESALIVAERTAGMLNWTDDPEQFRHIAEDDEFGILKSHG
jgi:predicted DNA-binding antitoxin AbrB/MazE fold protein